MVRKFQVLSSDSRKRSTIQVISMSSKDYVEELNCRDINGLYMSHQNMRQYITKHSFFYKRQFSTELKDEIF